MDDIEHDCHAQQAEGEGDEHLMNRMTEEFGSAFHAQSFQGHVPASRGPLFAVS
jgi:hypothetical protein